MIVFTGDIGGTTTRLQLTEFSDDGNKRNILKRECYKSAQYQSLIEIVHVFLQEARLQEARLGEKKIYSACFAGAGPITDGKIKFTNLPWVVDAKVIQQDLKIDKVDLINDFQGISYGIGLVQPEDIHVLQTGIPKENSIKSLIGAGTGLGMGMISVVGNKCIVFPSEGGHVDFAPTDEVQINLLLYMYKKYRHISVERLVSGQGLINIYQFVRDSFPCFNERESSDLQLALNSGLHSGADIAATIVEYATRHGNGIAIRALDIFVRIYGATAGNLALTTLPYGGLYIAGGIAPQLISQLSAGSFMAAFLDKGRMSELLKNIPVYTVKNTFIGLDGTALYASRM